MGLYWECDVIEDLGYPKYEIAPSGIIINYDYSAGCEMFRAVFLANVMNKCPVATGHLLYSVNSKTQNTTIRCWTNCDYAQYVEYGTAYMSAQPYFEPSLNTAFEMAVEIWDSEMNNVSAYLGGRMDAYELNATRQTVKAVAVGLVNTILSIFTTGLDISANYSTSHGIELARYQAELFAQYTMINTWMLTGSAIKGLLAGMGVGFVSFIFMAPLLDAIFGIGEDAIKSEREREAKKKGTGIYALLPPVRIT